MAVAAGVFTWLVLELLQRDPSPEGAQDRPTGRGPPLSLVRDTDDSVDSVDAQPQGRHAAPVPADRPTQSQPDVVQESKQRRGSTGTDVCCELWCRLLARFGNGG